MKNGFIVLSLIMVLSLFSSCSMQKRTYSKGYHIEWFQNSKIASAKIDKKDKESDIVKVKRTDKISENDEIENPVILDEYEIPEETIEASNFANENEPSIIANNDYDDSECDVVVTRDGRYVEAKVIEISQDVIKYKKCDNLDGPVYSIKKSSVALIKYSNGVEEVFEKEVNTNDATNAEGQVYHPMAIASLVLTILGAFLPILTNLLTPSLAFSSLGDTLNAVGGVSLLIGFILGLISYSRIRNNSKKYKGMGMAIASIVLGFIYLFVMLLLLVFAFLFILALF